MTVSPLSLKILYAFRDSRTGWQAATRNASGGPVADLQKFPNGIKDLSDKIHAMGLKVRTGGISKDYLT